MVIYIEGTYRLSDGYTFIHHNSLNNIEDEYTARFDLQTEHEPIKVKLYPKRSCFTITHEFVYPHESFEEDTAHQLVTEKKLIMEEFGKKVLSTIKFGLNLSSFNDGMDLIDFKWTINKMDWYTSRYSSTTTLSRANYYLDGNEEIVRSYLQNSYEPFIALKHLHRAKNDDDPRFKWIDATIAAELAIKEFFVRKNPILKVMLLELPSPPLKKLYKNLLLEYAGEESPLPSKFFDDASRIRNELVHRPQDVELTLEKANEYVTNIEKVIYHLLSLLYPDDRAVQVLYKAMMEPVRRDQGLGDEDFDFINQLLSKSK